MSWFFYGHKFIYTYIYIYVNVSGIYVRVSVINEACMHMVFTIFTENHKKKNSKELMHYFLRHFCVNP